MDREKIIKELHDARRYLENKEWSDRGASPHIDAINDALALLKDDETQLQYRDDHIAMYQAEIKRLEALLKEQETVEHALEVLRKAGWTETQDVPFPAELLKEQEPVKPNGTRKAMSFAFNGMLIGYCPRCGTMVNSVGNSGACGKCGQKFDWESEQINV